MSLVSELFDPDGLLRRTLRNEDGQPSTARRIVLALGVLLVVGYYVPTCSTILDNGTSAYRADRHAYEVAHGVWSRERRDRWRMHASPTLGARVMEVRLDSGHCSQGGTSRDTTLAYRGRIRRYTWFGIPKGDSLFTCGGHLSPTSVEAAMDSLRQDMRRARRRRRERMP